MIILGVDPGIATGYVLVNATSAKKFELIHCGVVRGYEGVKKLLSLKPHPEVIVVENFVLWPNLAVKVSHDDPELLTVRYIGALSYEAFANGLRLVFHQPSFKKACPDYLIKRYGLWSNAQTPHERDAIRHAVVFTRREIAARQNKNRKKGIKNLKEVPNGKKHIRNTHKQQ